MKVGPGDTASEVLVVAEIGNNHEGDVGVARELIECAAGAGADAAKLQVFDPAKYVGPEDPRRVAQLERFRLSPDAIAELGELAGARGLGFISTALDLGSMELIKPLVDAIKIASGDNDNPAFLAAAAETGLPVIVSAGMSDLAALRRARRVVEQAWARRSVAGELAVLHCVSAYPVTPLDARLASIPWLARELGCTIGYSDHTLGIETCVIAAALGARILEKHFTLRHDFSDFRDHQLSAEPQELAVLVDRVRGVQAMIGEPADGVLPTEEPVLAAARRSIRSVGDLPAGHVLRAEDLTWLRPRGEGLPPGAEHRLVGRALVQNVTAGTPLCPDDVERAMPAA